MLTIRDATGSPDVKVEGEIDVSEPPIEDETDLMIVGPTERGPAFVPKEIRRQKDLDVMFGPGKTYTSYAARKALEETDRIKMVRVMHEKGWVDQKPLLLYAKVNPVYDFTSITNSDTQINSDRILLSVFVLSEDKSEEIDITQTELLERGRRNDKPLLETFRIRFKDYSGNVVQTLNLSFNNFSRRYVGDVLSEEKGFNLFLNFEETQQKLLDFDGFASIDPDPSFEVETNWTNFSASVDSVPTTPINFKNQSYRYARTPWIVSQTLANGKRYPLFRFVARGAGNSENQRFKVSINEIGDFREDSEYGFFTVQIRGFTDNDFTPDVLEEYADVTLDPNHERFIKRVIGDRWEELKDDGQVVKRGKYENQSDYVRVEFDEEGVREAGKQALPYGFKGYSPPVSSSYLDDEGVFLQSPNYQYNQEIGNITKYADIRRPDSAGDLISDDVHLGFDFQKEENNSWLNPVANDFDECFFIDPSIDENSTEYQNKCGNVENIFKDDGFHLEDAEDKVNEYSTDNIKARKFSVGLQGGFDGASPYREKSKASDITDANTFGFDLSDTKNEDYRSYVKAINLLSEVTGGFQFNLLSTPGLDLNNHFPLVNFIEQTVRNRGDAFYITEFDIFNYSIDDIVKTGKRVDTSYLGAYYGWFSVDETADFLDYVPASSLVPAVYIRNDNLREPWIAPTGYNRGVVENAQDVVKRLTKKERDRLYNNGINSIDNFSPDQVLLWGQKTQYDEQDSALTQISVRRLLVTVKSETRRIARNNLFEQITEENLRSFERDLREVLSDVRQSNGITNYDVTIRYDFESREDQNLIEGEISISPIDVVEYILINFVLEDNSFTFV